MASASLSALVFLLLLNFSAGLIDLGTVGLPAFNCSKLDKNHETEDVFKNNCTSPAGDFVLNITGSHKEDFEKWMETVENINVNVSIWETNIGRIVFPKLKSMEMYSFMVMNNSELKEIDFNNAPIKLIEYKEELTSHLYIGHNPQLKSIKGIRENNQSLIHYDSEWAIEFNDQLPSLEIAAFTGALRVDNNPSLESLSLPGYIDETTNQPQGILLFDKVVIQENSNLKKITILDENNPGKWLTNSAELYFSYLPKMKEINLSGIGKLRLGMLAISLEEVTAIRFNKKMEELSIGSIELRENLQLKTVILPEEVNQVKVKRIVLEQNHKLEMFPIPSNWTNSSTTVHIRFSPSLTSYEWIYRIARPLNIENNDACSFLHPVQNLSSLDPCWIIDGNLTFATTAYEEMICPPTIVAINGNLTLNNVHPDWLDCLKSARIQGHLSSSLCDFDYSAFPYADSTAPFVACPVGWTGPTGQEGKAPSTTPQYEGEEELSADDEITKLRSKKENNKTKLTAVIIIGSILLVLIVIGIVICVVARRKKNKKRSQQRTEMESSSSSEEESVEELSSR